MRKLIAVIIAFVISTNSANAFLAAVLMPSPIGVALVVGKWIYDEYKKKRYYIEVIGYGDTAESARLNGFRVAVEQAAGTIIASETEVENDQLVRDEIISYAGAYVEKYEIEEVKTVGDQTHTKMKVWIGYTGLANRLLHESSTVGSINGQQAEASLTTAQEQFTQSDRLFATVLHDFPKRAFTVQSEPPTLTYDSNRQGVINIPVKISWNYDYLLSLAQVTVSSAASTNEKLCYQSPGNCPYKSYIRVISGIPPWEATGWTGWNETVAFNDVVKINMLATEMVMSHPALLVTIDGEPDYNQCHRWPEFDHVDDYRTPTKRFVTFGQIQASVNGDFALNGVVTVPVKNDHLFTMDQIKLEVVRDKKCPART